MLHGIISLFLLFLVFVIVIVAIMVSTVVRYYLRAKDLLKGKDTNRQRKSPTIVDTRSEEVANRKIFSKDEGEYVDYT